MKKLILLSILIFWSCDNSIETEDVYGCMDLGASNYNPNATISDDSCEYFPFHDFTNFETINGMDESGNPTNIIGDGIWGACIDASQDYNNLNNILQIHSTILNRTDDASSAHIIRTDSTVLFEANGYIGGVQMTLSHGSDFVITLTTDALITDYVTDYANDTTRLVIVSPSTNLLFNYIGDFKFEYILIANSQSEVGVEILYNEFSSPFPNPFNESTSIIINLNEADSIKVIIVDNNYNKVATLLDGYLDAGEYPITWDATNIQNGNYRIIADLGTKQCFVNINKEAN